MSSTLRSAASCMLRRPSPSPANWKPTSDQQVHLTVDGTKYNTSDLSFYTDGNKLADAQCYQTLDKEATFYLDGQGNVIAVDGTAASNNYAFLWLPLGGRC